MKYFWYTLTATCTENGYAYGLHAEEEGNPVLSIKDISHDAPFVERLIGLFNLGQLDPVHVLDVLEDLLP